MKPNLPRCWATVFCPTPSGIAGMPPGMRQLGPRIVHTVSEPEDKQDYPPSMVNPHQPPKPWPTTIAVRAQDCRVPDVSLQHTIRHLLGAHRGDHFTDWDAHLDALSFVISELEDLAPLRDTHSYDIAQPMGHVFLRDGLGWYPRETPGTLFQHYQSKPPLPDSPLLHVPFGFLLLDTDETTSAHDKLRIVERATQDLHLFCHTTPTLLLL